MTAQDTTTGPPPPGRPPARHESTGRRTAGPRRRALLRAEVHRLAARRFIRYLLLLAVAGYAVVVPLVAWTQFSVTTPQVRAQAEQEIARIAAEQERFRTECLRQPLPPDSGATTIEEFCGPPFDPSGFDVESFLPKRPFVLADYYGPGALAIGVATAALLFVIGATWVGAEWSARTMMALLFWETRRLRVLGTKAFVLAVAAALVAAFAQLVWAGSAYLIADTRGVTGPLPPDFWADAAATGGRTVLLGTLAALLGFAVAHLIRSTGAALGVAFVYFAIVETAVQSFRPGWSPWLLTVNAAALVLDGGTTVFVPGTAVDDTTGQVVEYTERVVTNLHGGLVFGGATLVLVLLGAWLFRRRDLT